MSTFNTLENGILKFNMGKDTFIAPNSYYEGKVLNVLQAIINMKKLPCSQVVWHTQIFESLYFLAANILGH